jgi:hypothetical protein
MDGVIKEMDDLLPDRGVELKRRNERWKVSHLLYADDAVLMGESESELQELVNGFTEVCKRRNLKMNADKCKVMVFERSGESECEITIDGEVLEVVNEFKYLGSVLEKKGGCDRDVNNRVVHGRRVAGIMSKIVNKHGLSVDCSRGLYESMLVPTLLYGSETIFVNERDESRIRAVEMDFLRRSIDVRRLDRVRNVDVREACGVNVGVEKMRERSLLRWFGHVRRMDERRVVKRIYESECEGRGRRGRPRREWENGINECLEHRGTNVLRVRRMVEDRDI